MPPPPPLKQDIALLVAALLVQYLLPCLKNSAQKMLYGLGPQIDFAFFNV